MSVGPKEGWALNKWCFWIVVLDKTLDSPLDCKEIKPGNPKGNQSWIFIGRQMLKMKLQYFAFLMWRAKSLEKTLMLGKTEGRRRIGQQRWDSWMASATQWTWVWANSRDSERQGSLACCSSRGHRVGHDLATKQVTICEQLNQWPKSNSLSYLFVVIHYLFWLWSSVNGEINLLFKTDIVCAVKSGFSFERGRHRGTQDSHTEDADLDEIKNNFIAQVPGYVFGSRYQDWDWQLDCMLL